MCVCVFVSCGHGRISHMPALLLWTIFLPPCALSFAAPYEDAHPHSISVTTLIVCGHSDVHWVRQHTTDMHCPSRTEVRVSR